jgi:DinB superfamily
MAGKHAQDLRRRIDAAWENLSRQLHGMDAHMERADAPGEWTTREVLSHLLFEPGFDPAATLASFSERGYPLIEIDPGATFLDDQRRQMTLPELRNALDAQRRRLLGYIDALEEREFDQRKARIPLFKQFMGTDEITIDMFLGAMFDYHWNDHADQLEKIRQAIGLGRAAAAKPSGVPS